MKIKRYLLSLAAAAGLVAACQAPEMVQMDLSQAIAPVMHDIDSAGVKNQMIITAQNQTSSVTFTWDAADFGVATQVDYSVEAALGEGDKVVILSGISGTEGVQTYEAVNQVLYNDLFKVNNMPEAVLTDVNFYVGAKVGEAQKLYSEPVVVKVAVTAAEKQYPKMYIVGSYNGWSHDSNFYLYDFDGDDAVYSGIIDFGAEHASNEFKITAGAWGNGEHSMNGAHDPEADVVALVAGGGDNINVYQANRYYHLSLDKTVPSLTKNLAFDQIGVIGDFNGWGGDVVMELDPVKQKFYADVEFPADGGFKFRLDADWAVSYGSTGNGKLDSGDNIPVTAGNYRVYLNMNNLDEMTYELNADDYGKQQEVVVPDKPVMVGWGIVGSITNWGNLTEDNTYIADIALISDGTWYVANNVEIPEGAEIKFRLDGGWDSQWGAGADFTFAPNTELTLSNDGSSAGNITPAASTYNIYLNPETGAVWFINDGSYPGGGAAPEASIWGIVGVVNSWAAPDIPMYATSTADLFVAYNVVMPDGGFKIRANGEWNDAANYGLATAGNVEVDHAYDVISSGTSGDMTLVAGTYDIWFDYANEKVYIMTPGKPISEAEGGVVETPDPSEQVWHLVGGFNGWAAADPAYALTAEGDWYVFRNFTADGQGVKFVVDAGWAVNRGGAFVAANEAIALTQGGSDMIVAAGTYDVYLNKDADTAYFMEVGKTPGN